MKRFLASVVLAGCMTATAVQASTIYSQDFSSGLSANEAVGGAFGLYKGTVGHPGGYGDYDYSYYDLSLDLTGVTDAVLEIDYDIALEAFHDRFNVLASSGAFSPPAGLLTPISGMAYTTIDPTQYTPLLGTTAVSSNMAGRAVFDLAAFSGQAVNLRFQFQSDYSIVGRGVNLDNVVVTGAQMTSGVPEPATWAMMIIGFGAAGSMVRTARRRNALGVA